jgi:hypothetical protein
MKPSQKYLWIDVHTDERRRLFAAARILLADGSTLCIESTIYREGGVDGADPAVALAAGVEPVRNQAIDEALDKLCTVVSHPAVMAAIPLPARLALKMVCKARNLQKIKQAAAAEGDDDEEQEAAGELEIMLRHGDAIERRAVGALRIWA